MSPQVVPLSLEVDHKIRGLGMGSDLEAVIATDKMYMYLDKLDTLNGGYNLFNELDENCLFLRNYNGDKDLDWGGANGYSDYLRLMVNIPTIITICR